jgi:hypothetical protein
MAAGSVRLRWLADVLMRAEDGPGRIIHCRRRSSQGREVSIRPAILRDFRSQLRDSECDSNRRGATNPARQSRNRRTELSAPGWEIRNPKSEIRNKSKNTETPKLRKRGSEISSQLASNFDYCSAEKRIKTEPLRLSRSAGHGISNWPCCCAFLPASMIRLA